MIPEGRRGVTLVEILICMVILGLIAVPLVELLVTSKKVSVSGRDRLTAMSLASSYVTSISALRKPDVQEANGAEDSTFTGPMSLADLGIDAPPDGYRRTLGLEKLPPDPAGQVLCVATVTIEWESSISGQPVSYTLYRVF